MDTAEPPSGPCGSQRPAINGAPGVGPDGTVYVASRAHMADRYSYLLAVNPDLTPRWAASFRDRLSDGCGNELPAGRVVDPGTNSPVVTPDGSILFGTYTEYNRLRGQLFKFSAAGAFQGTYDFGLDLTPSIYIHDGTYSMVGD